MRSSAASLAWYIMRPSSAAVSKHDRAEPRPARPGSLAVADDCMEPETSQKMTVLPLRRGNTWVADRDTAASKAPR